MSYNYKIGYYSHEESNYVELQHEKQFNDDELTEMVAEATVETIKKMKRAGDRVHDFQHVFDNEGSNIAQYLIEKFGFKYIEYELCWRAFGWASIFDKTDWKDDRGNHLDKITDIVNNAGVTRKDDDDLRENDELNNIGKKL